MKDSNIQLNFVPVFLSGITGMLCLCSSSYLFFCHCLWSGQVLPRSCLSIRGPQQVATTSERFCGLAEMILFLWNGSWSRKEWKWNIIEWNIIISRYLFLAAKLPHKELGTILINCLHFHLFSILYWQYHFNFYFFDIIFYLCRPLSLQCIGKYLPLWLGVFLFRPWIFSEKIPFEP